MEETIRNFGGVSLAKRVRVAEMVCDSLHRTFITDSYRWVTTPPACRVLCEYDGLAASKTRDITLCFEVFDGFLDLLVGGTGLEDYDEGYGDYQDRVLAVRVRQVYIDQEQTWWRFEIYGGVGLSASAACDLWILTSFSRVLKRSRFNLTADSLETSLR
jgi:hypothetical protein